MVMKKVIGLLFMIFLSICVFSCSKEAEKQSSNIFLSELTNEQKDIVNLLSNNKNEIFIFNYETKEKYRRMEVWLEIY